MSNRSESRHMMRGIMPILILLHKILLLLFFFLMIPPPPRSTLFPYTTLFRSLRGALRLSPLCGSEHDPDVPHARIMLRSEEHTSELQSLRHLVCRLLLEKKKETTAPIKAIILASIYQPHSVTNSRHTPRLKQ